jgi:hypothetical protein
MPECITHHDACDCRHAAIIDEIEQRVAAVLRAETACQHDRGTAQAEYALLVLDIVCGNLRSEFAAIRAERR